MWNLTGNDPRELPSLTLAYVGDAVYELYIRLYLVAQGLVKGKELHVRASELVRAARQAEFLHILEPRLTEEEWAVAKRGRNSNSSHVPKNAETIDYRWSTGFETLIGYLFIRGEEIRIKELLEYVLSQYESGKE